MAEARVTTGRFTPHYSTIAVSITAIGFVLLLIGVMSHTYVIKDSKNALAKLKLPGAITLICTGAIAFVAGMIYKFYKDWKSGQAAESLSDRPMEASGNAQEAPPLPPPLLLSEPPPSLPLKPIVTLPPSTLDPAVKGALHEAVTQSSSKPSKAPFHKVFSCNNGATLLLGDGALKNEISASAGIQHQAALRARAKRTGVENNHEPTSSSQKRETGIHTISDYSSSQCFNPFYKSQQQQPKPAAAPQPVRATPPTLASVMREPSKKEPSLSRLTFMVSFNGGVGLPKITGINHLRKNVHDLNQESLYAFFTQVDHELNNGKAVFFQCDTGDNESAAFMVLYIASRTGCSFEEAHAYINGQRKILPYNEGESLMTEAYALFRAMVASNALQTLL